MYDKNFQNVVFYIHDELWLCVLLSCSSTWENPKSLPSISFNDLKAFLYFICKTIYYLTFKTG